MWQGCRPGERVDPVVERISVYDIATPVASRSEMDAHDASDEVAVRLLFDDVVDGEGGDHFTTGTVHRSCTVVSRQSLEKTEASPSWMGRSVPGAEHTLNCRSCIIALRP